MITICFGSLGAQEAVRTDSTEVAVLYANARTVADRKPLQAKAYLYKLVAYVDSVIMPKHPKRDFLIERKATALHFLSYFERRETNFEKAIVLAQQSIDLKLEHGLDSLLATTYLQKAKAWQMTFQHKEALNLLLKADSIAEKYQQKTTLLEIYSSMGSTFVALKDTLNADRYYKNSLRLADSVGTNYQKALAYSNYASFLRLGGHYEENLPYLQKAIELHRTANNKIGLESGLYALGLHYNNTGDPQKAISYLREAISLSLELKSTATLPFRYKALSESYEALNNYKMAYETHELYKAALDQRNSIEETKRMAQTEKEWQYQKQKIADSIRFAHKKMLDESELKRKANTRFWAVVTGLFLILGGIAFFYLRNRQKVKEQAYQNILLNNKIANKSEEINELLTETMRHIKSRERLADNLQKLSQEKDGITLKSIIADLKASKADNAKLMLIKQNIEQVNFEFIKKLKSQHPNLTKTDVEICSFIRIGLSRKEIANLRNTTLEAVKSSRFRLKKKLDLSAQEDLDEFVNSL